ncbi:MAG TPA: flavin reductase family protein [Pseudomonadales bacterium]
MHIVMDQLSASQRYFTMIQTMIPRPVAWVLSDNGDGSLNLAPFSYFSPVSSAPPLLMVSIGKKPDGSDKDTRSNILQRSHFVVHIASAAMAQQVTDSSASLPFGESEVTALGLATCDFNGFSLPRLAEPSVALACRFHDVSYVGDVPQAIVFGRIEQVYIADAVLDSRNGRWHVDAEKVDPLGRLGADEYWTGGRVSRIRRPD